MPSSANIFIKATLMAALSFLITVGFYYWGGLDLVELKSYDFLSRSLNGPKGPADVVIVKIDQQSLDALNAEGINWPWPRQMYAPLVEYLSEADAVLMDILFTESSSYGRSDDQLFAEAVAKNAKVYVPTFLTNQKKNLLPSDENFIKKHALVGDAKGLIRFSGAIPPIEELQRVIAGTGNVTISPARDGVYRSVPLVFAMQNYVLANLSLVSLLKDKKLLFKDGELRFDDKKVHLQGNNMLLKFFSSKHPFTEISALDIFQAELAERNGRKPTLQREFFKGKTVFVGLTAAGLFDLRPTSITPVATGITIHATTFANLRSNSYLYPIARPLVFLIMFCLALLTNLAVLRFYNLLITLSIYGVAMLSTASATGLLFMGGVYLEAVPIMMTITVGFILSTTFSYAVEGRERRFVLRAFCQYMDKKLVKYILANPEMIKPGGEKRQVTVFFADIANFTTMAEKLPAEETALILTTVLDKFTEIIIRNSGVVDKYIGDCIMAFWGAPLSFEDDEKNACRTALEFLAALDKMNEDFRKQGLAEISIRIGIHSGTAIAGNLGSNRIFDFTVIGDTVNLASRLEGVNKTFSTQVLVSEDTRRKIGEEFQARLIGPVEVKGKNKAIAVYELLAWAENISEEKRQMLNLYDSALNAFQQGKIIEAKELFQELLSQYPDDGPANFYQKWCASLCGQESLTPGWQIIKMKSK